MCTQAITAGYGGLLAAGGEQHEFRTDESGVLVRLLPGAALAARQFLAGELGLDPEGIRVSYFEAVEWPDSCLGVSGRGECVSEITSGYQVILEVGEDWFLIHTDQSGGKVILAGTPDQPAVITQLNWSGLVDERCYQAEITMETLAYGACDEQLVSQSFVSSPRWHEFEELTNVFNPFVAETAAGEITFSGPTGVIPSSLQQRMIAEWARLVVQEAIDQGNPAAAVLSWRREGGEPNICEELSLDSAGLAIASACGSGESKELGRARLTTIQLKRLYDWIDGLSSYELENALLLETGTVTTRIVFTGRGENKALDVHQQEMDAFAQELFTHLSQPQDKAEIEAARQSLLAYMIALNEGRYDDAADFFGGDMQVLREYNPNIPADDRAALFQAACMQNGFVCELSVLNEISAARITPTKFRFVVELQYADGSQFVLGSCCGTDPSGEPLATQFEFYVEQLDGRYLVLTLPVYSA